MKKEEKKMIKKVVKDEAKTLIIIKGLMKYSNWKNMIKYLYKNNLIGEQLLSLYDKFDSDVDELAKYISKKI